MFLPYVGVPSASRAWRWRMLAPASTQRRASAAISSGVMGRCGLSRLVGTIPVSAALMISLPSRPILFRLNGAFRHARGDAHHLNMIGQIADHYCTGGDGATFADILLIDDDGTHADVGLFTDCNRSGDICAGLKRTEIADGGVMSD